MFFFFERALYFSSHFSIIMSFYFSHIGDLIRLWYGYSSSLSILSSLLLMLSSGIFAYVQCMMTMSIYIHMYDRESRINSIIVTIVTCIYVIYLTSHNIPLSQIAQAIDETISLHCIRVYIHICVYRSNFHDLSQNKVNYPS